MKSLKPFLLLAALFSSPTFAASPRLPEAGATLTAEGPVALRSASPDPDFGTAGDRLGWLREGDEAQVLTAKQTLTLFGPEVWLEVRTKDGRHGWIRDGRTNEVLSGHGALRERPAANLLTASR